MTLFEYIMVLTSILIGLGIAELLSGVVRMLRSEFKEGIFIPQLMWAGFLFLMLIIFWWSRWDLRNVGEWTFFRLIFSLLGPSLAFILSGLVFPENKQAKDHYFDQQKPFFGLLITLSVINMIHEIIFEGTSAISIETALSLTVIFGLVWLMFTKNRYAHLTISTVSFLLLFIYVSVNSYTLQL